MTFFNISCDFNKTEIFNNYNERRLIRLTRVKDINIEKLEAIANFYIKCKETKSIDIEEYNLIGAEIQKWGGKISGKTRQEKNDLAISLLTFLRDQNKELFINFSVNTLELLSIELFGFSPTERSLSKILFHTYELKRITENGRIYDRNINVVRNIIKTIIFNTKEINKVKKEFFYRYRTFRNDVKLLNIDSSLAYLQLKNEYNNKI